MSQATLTEPGTNNQIPNEPITETRIRLSPRGYFGYVDKVYDITKFVQQGKHYRYADGLLIHKPNGKWTIY